MINVTKTFLPPLDEYIDYLKEIWAKEHITNHGACALDLERKLKDYLQVKHLFLVNNGTIALQIAIKALNLQREIITTPFSYVATTSSIVWENCTPVFADIDPDTLCISPTEVEKKINKNTSAILATHVYGNPCDVERLEIIAKKNGIRIIYDAAHAFGVRYKTHSILNWGDISTLSFHATKIFHTVEGGAIITNDDDLAHKISYMRNFGHNGPEDFWGVGVNGKNSELHAAMGLANLKHMDKIIAARKEISLYYDQLLSTTDLLWPQQPKELDYNYSYYPVVFKSETQLLKAKVKLNELKVFPRRYFYPSLNKLNYVKDEACPVSETISERVLCLPLYVGLDHSQVKQISDTLISALK